MDKLYTAKYDFQTWSMGKDGSLSTVVKKTQNQETLVRQDFSVHLYKNT